MPRYWRIWSVAAAITLAAVAGAQERESSSPYFECPYINYFDSDCPQLKPEEARAAPPTENDPQQPEGAEEPESDDDWLEDNPELLLPLFPKESLAPDTPTLYRMLLIKPTLETARRYVRWYERRMRRIREAQALVEVAGRELLAERGARE